VTDAERARELLERARTRGDIRALAPRLDDDPDLRRAVLDEGRRRGVELPDDAIDWPAKRLLRVARGREAEARMRTTPIHRDEAFTCAHCGGDVPPHGRTARDHCPWCLRSLHVDVVPGDRAASCHGVLDPVAFELVGGQPVLRHRCRRCGTERRVRAVTDGEVPDDWEALVALSSGAG
jgi:hypothetical protein